MFATLIIMSDLVMSFRDISSLLLMYWLSTKLLSINMCWLYGVYSMYENDSAAYHHLQQLSRRRAGNVWYTFVALFCIVNTWDDIRTSNILSSIPNAPYMTVDDTMNTLKIASKFPEIVRLHCYAANFQLFCYSVFAHICMEALSYYMFNDFDFHNIFPFSSSKGLLDLTHEQGKQPSD